MAGRIGRFLGRIFGTARTSAAVKPTGTESTTAPKKEPHVGLASLQQDTFERAGSSPPPGRLHGGKDPGPIGLTEEWGDGPDVNPGTTGHHEKLPKPEHRGETVFKPDTGDPQPMSDD